ncbi:DUF4344 domain-containing metallopeptidase [Mycolicibacterium komossense]|uniref:DUF4344 domain-containing metallopeptidase n=1 Tax=Mycolicibacterium komossense TaxID=1779 RepID=A0ABT3CE34_9MYCO|nr:DUF4344 domain-containing metallopeptidase [Mycolicibacterium komossense]MCV7227652.1 DUF4344 domain-containing metallopeptidase [Mycolicibacterium komossense]
MLVSACGRDEKAKSEELPESSVSTAQAAPASPTNTDVNHNGIPDAEDNDWPGKMIPDYQAATSPDAVRGRDLIQQAHLLEDMADSINESLKLPFDIPLIGKQCDTANAFWDPNDNTVTICYEDAADGLDIYTKAGDADPRASAINAEVATFYHETGHMVVSIYDLPATGREEDVADQLSAYILLTPGPDGKADPDNIRAVKDFAREFEGYADAGGEVDDDALADTHSPNKTRMYNLECWVYGSDPEANADLVGGDQLPQDRADGCQEEYEKMSHAWDTLLAPYLK